MRVFIDWGGSTGFPIRGKDGQTTPFGHLTKRPALT